MFVFLSGLHRHLSGLSKLPLEQRLLLRADDPFPLPFFYTYEKPYFPLFRGYLLYTYEHVVENLPQAQRSTAQRK